MGVQFDDWAMQQPPFGLPPAWWYLLTFKGGSSGKTGYPGWPLPSIGACRVAGRAAF